MQSFQYIHANNLPLSSPNRPVSKTQSAIVNLLETEVRSPGLFISLVLVCTVTLQKYLVSEAALKNV